MEIRILCIYFGLTARRLILRQLMQIEYDGFRLGFVVEANDVGAQEVAEQDEDECEEGERRIRRSVIGQRQPATNQTNRSHDEWWIDVSQAHGCLGWNHILPRHQTDRILNVSTPFHKEGVLE